MAADRFEVFLCKLSGGVSVRFGGSALGYGDRSHDGGCIGSENGGRIKGKIVEITVESVKETVVRSRDGKMV